MKEGEGIWKEGREKRIGEKDGNRDCSQGHEDKKEQEITDKGRIKELERRKRKRLQRRTGKGISEKERNRD